jgi:type III pantothenate kinase
MPSAVHNLIAVDIGNSRIKLGQFDPPPFSTPLPAPAHTLEIPLANRDGQFDAAPMEHWCEAHVKGDAVWRIATVHSGAMALWMGVAKRLARSFGREWSIRVIANDEVPLAIDVEFPELVGTDRLMAALAANQLRAPDRAAIVIDMGTAITVDLVTSEGAFAGGAILPGLAMSAQALDDHTDALPCIAVDRWREPPAPLGKATEPAIEAGLFWGAVGATRELIGQYSMDFPSAPDVFISGGGSQLIADMLQRSHDRRVLHVPHLVLSGIALVDSAEAGNSRTQDKG